MWLCKVLPAHVRTESMCAHHAALVHMGVLAHILQVCASMVALVKVYRCMCKCICSHMHSKSWEKLQCNLCAKLCSAAAKDAALLMQDMLRAGPRLPSRDKCQQSAAEGIKSGIAADVTRSMTE